MKKISMYILLVTLLMNCSKDPSVEKSVASLKLSATCSGIVTKSTSVLPSDLSVGIYVTAKDALLSAAPFSNRKYVSGDSGGLTSDQNIDLIIGNSYDIYAYAPYQSVVSDPTAVTFNHGTDVLWTPKYTLAGVTATNNTATLAFAHRAAQISFNVVFADDFSAGSKVITSSSTIQVSGFYSHGVLNASNGVFTPSGSADASLSGIGTGTAGAMTLGVGATCFVPASGAMTLNVKVVHEGRTYNGTITDTFSAGSSYNYTVTLSGHSPVPGISGTLTDWTFVSDSISLQ